MCQFYLRKLVAGGGWRTQLESFFNEHFSNSYKVLFSPETTAVFCMVLNTWMKNVMYRDVNTFKSQLA